MLKDSLLSPKWVRMPAVPPYESPASHFIQLHFFQSLGSQIWSLQNINMSQVDQAGMARDCILCVCVCVCVCVSVSVCGCLWGCVGVCVCMCVCAHMHACVCVLYLNNIFILLLFFLFFFS